MAVAVGHAGAGSTGKRSAARSRPWLRASERGG